jgi:glutamyl-Q tRNA(Asp) synthetase
MSVHHDWRYNIGRFAPSPTGYLHEGSIMTAVASYLLAKQHGGQCWLRIEDVDAQRCRPEYATMMRKTLACMGFRFDGSVIYQQNRLSHYTKIMEDLALRGWVYPCRCTREMIARYAQQGEEGYIYHDACRPKQARSYAFRMTKGESWRFRLPDQSFTFEDALWGWQSNHPRTQYGDFVLVRADGFFAYHLAVVVDDIAMGVNQVVRGADLLSATTRQLALYQALGHTPPNYVHLPLIVNALGQKVAKQTHAQPIHDQSARFALWHALVNLGQSIPPLDTFYDVHAVWQWADQFFTVTSIPTKPIMERSKASQSPDAMLNVLSKNA